MLTATWGGQEFPDVGLDVYGPGEESGTFDSFTELVIDAVAGGKTVMAPADGSKVTQAGGPEVKQMTGPATFCAAREEIAPQTVEVRAWVEDALPGRERSYSATFILHVLNATDHSLWLTQQMSKWLEVARESYEREQQLHAMNKELRAMTAAELARCRVIGARY